MWQKLISFKLGILRVNLLILIMDSFLQKASLVWGGEKSGGGAGGGTQGLAHWMSVMAEHMNHEPSSLHPAYMWNGVEVRSQKCSSKFYFV